MKLESEKVDRQHLEELILKVQEDKKRLAHRVNKLIANGQHVCVFQFKPVMFCVTILKITSFLLLNTYYLIPCSNNFHACLLHVAEKDMVLEIDCLKHRNGVVRKHGKMPNRMDQLVRSLEEERNYWKSEVEVLQKLMKSRPSSRSSSRPSSPTRSRSRTGTPTKTKSRSSSPSNSAKFDHMVM